VDAGSRANRFLRRLLQGLGEGAFRPALFRLCRMPAFKNVSDGVFSDAALAPFLVLMFCHGRVLTSIIRDEENEAQEAKVVGHLCLSHPMPSTFLPQSPFLRTAMFFSSRPIWPNIRFRSFILSSETVVVSILYSRRYLRERPTFSV